MDSLRSPTCILMPPPSLGGSSVKIGTIQGLDPKDGTRKSKNVNNSLYSSLYSISPVLLGSLRPLMAHPPMGSLGTASGIPKGIIGIMETPPALPPMGGQVRSSKIKYGQLRSTKV